MAGGRVDPSVRGDRHALLPRLPWRRFFRHPGLDRSASSLSKVTTGTGRNHVIPGVGAMLSSGNYMIQSQILILLAAVLAGVAVAKKYFFLGKLAGQEWPFDQIHQADY